MKNVVFLTIDALIFRAGAFAGRPVTPCPTLDSIFESGLGFTNAFTVGCPTQFAMPGYFASQLPLDGGGYEYGIRDRETSFVEVLKEAGYRTGAFTTADATGRMYGYDRGFDDFHSLFVFAETFRFFCQRCRKHYLPRYADGRHSLDFCVSRIAPVLDAHFSDIQRAATEKLAELEEATLVLSPAVHNWDFDRLRTLAAREQRRLRDDPHRAVEALLCASDEMSWITELASCWADVLGRTSTPYSVTRLLENDLPASRWERSCSGRCVVENTLRWTDRAGDAPFFVWAHLLDAHEYRSTSFDIGTHAEIDAEVEQALRLKGRIDALGGAYLGDLSYDLAVGYVDAQVKKLLSGLEAQGHLNDTIIVVGSDHGWPTGFPTRQRLEITDFYDEFYHVPVCFSGAGIEPRRVDALASTMDVAPTLLDLVGLRAPAGMRGQVASAPSWPGRDHVLFEHVGRGPCDLTTKPLRMCVRSRTNKIICEVPPPSSGAGEGFLDGLWDLTADPLEQRDLKLSMAFPPELERMVEIAEARATELLEGIAPEPVATAAA